MTDIRRAFLISLLIFVGTVFYAYAQQAPAPLTPSDLDQAITTPTTEANVEKRAQILMWWAGLLKNEGTDIDKAYNPKTAQDIADNLHAGKKAEAVKLVDEAIQNMGKLDKRSQKVKDTLKEYTRPSAEKVVTIPYESNSVFIDSLVQDKNTQRSLEMQTRAHLVNLSNGKLNVRIIDAPLIISPDKDVFTRAVDVRNDKVGFIYQGFGDFDHVKKLGFGVVRLGALNAAFWGFYREGSPDGGIPAGEKYLDYLEKTVNGINSANLDMIMVIEPRRSNKLQAPRTGRIKYDPQYADEYKAFVDLVVKRLKGKVKTFSVSNEVEVAFDEESYALALQDTYDAMKNCCPECTLVTGGYIKDTGLTFYKRVFDKLAGKKAFDHFDLRHFYGYYEEYKGFAKEYSNARTILDDAGFKDVDIWMCEIGSPSLMPNRNNTSDFGQAVDVVRRFTTAFSIGVKKVLWAQVMDFHNYGDFDFVGLLRNPANGRGAGPKISYSTYSMLIKTMEGGDVHNITKVDTASDVTAYKFTKNNAPVYIVWRNDF